VISTKNSIKRGPFFRTSCIHLSLYIIIISSVIQFFFFFLSITNVIKESSNDLTFYNHDVACESNEHRLDDCPKNYVKARDIGRNCDTNSFVYVICDEIKENDVLNVYPTLNVSKMLYQSWYLPIKFSC